MHSGVSQRNANKKISSACVLFCEMVPRMLQCDVVQAVSKGVQQAIFRCCTRVIETEFQENATWFIVKLHFSFGGSNVATKVSVVVRTDDDTVTASCKLAWSISGLLFP